MKIQYLLGCVVFGVGTLLGFDGHKVTEGPVTLVIGDMGSVSKTETPVPVSVTVSNSGPHTVVVALELKGLLDDCRTIGEVKKKVSVEAKKQITTNFQFVMRKGSYSAHYPVHVNATFASEGKTLLAHAVQVFETQFEPTAPKDSTAPGLWPVNPVPSAGALALALLKTHRFGWNHFDKPEHYQPVGWQGSVTESSASLGRAATARGETRQSLNMHPTYRGGAGLSFVDYRLKMPQTQPIHLSFYNAIRDSNPKEPASDGVTFRVYANGKMLFDRHTDAKAWLSGDVDLSPFAGQEIVLRLESHPGPKKNTVCDSSYWGDPTVVVGTPPRTMSAEEKRRLPSYSFALEGGQKAVITPGANGLADGRMVFGEAPKQVVFEGFDMFVMENKVGVWPSAVVLQEARSSMANNGKLKVIHRLMMEERKFDLVAEIWKEGAGLRVKITCPERITDLAIGRADRKAARVFYGHGYAIVEPQAFRAGGGGHNLATSHVGFEFDNGLSLLNACDVPPDALQVDPEQKLYQLHAHPDTQFTFVPGTKGIFDCAIQYRPLYDKKAAPGVAPKAGRFVLDYWGGKYADNAAALSRIFDYGATNSLLIMHSWQRWGYDYRLPDIYPPNPKLGTVEDMQLLGRSCKERGVLWGLHDNYIDFYPDAMDFSYDHITFNPSGQPRKAWINDGRDAQSYQFRPDQMQPFLKRNLALMKADLQPTASFVDVFTSANSFDFYDRQGNFHSRLETRKCWGELFATIRETFGNNAPTTSEAGSDHLTGYIDGADCQFMQLTAQPKRYANPLRCEDWDRVPWFDAVNHTRMSLHGVGYSNRYQAGRARPLHGIESDDYISAELLTGHALMVDVNAGVRGAVRKYWLAQDFIQSIALDEIASVTMPDNDIHRLLITWKSSAAKVYVNRGEKDWSVAGHILPQYGYFAESGPIQSAIERINGSVVEWSRTADKFYVNGRGFDADPPVQVQPSLSKVEYLGGRKLKMLVDWRVVQRPNADYTMQYYFNKPHVSRLVKNSFSGTGKLPAPTSQWSGTVTTGNGWTITMPDDLPSGEYDILVSLFDGKNRRRMRMLGDEDPDRRFLIGRLVVDGNKTNVTGMKAEKSISSPAIAARLLVNKSETDFGAFKTAGAMQCRKSGNGLLLLPLPDGSDSSVLINLKEILGKSSTIKSISVVDNQGKKVRDIPFQLQGENLLLKISAKDFGDQINY